MKTYLVLLATVMALAVSTGAEAKKIPVEKKNHPAFKHTKADKKKVPARDTSAMPRPDSGPAKK